MKGASLTRRAKGLLYKHVLPDAVLSRIYRRWTQALPAEWLAHPFFLLHVPKCAGTSLARGFGLPDPGHLLVSDYAEPIRAGLAGKPALVVVRDPAARIVSTFRYAHQIARAHPTLTSEMTRFRDINAWVARLTPARLRHHYFLRPATAHIRAAQANGMAVHAIPMSRLEEGLGAFCDQLGIACPALPRTNVSEPDDALHIALSASARTRIEELYSEDLELLRRAEAEGLITLE